MTAATKTRVNAELDTVLKDLLQSVKRKPAAGEEPLSLTDKMKIIDRVLKWEAIKAKLNDGNWGKDSAMGKSIPHDMSYFEDRIQRIPWTGCWIWMKRVDKNGYGVMQLDGRGQRAHRVIMRLIGRPIPDKMMGCHSCDTTSCVNPDHIFVGDVKTNAEDAVTKGRYKYGERHKGAKITEEQAREIKYSSDSAKTLAQRYGIGTTQVRRIKDGEKWSHIIY